MTTEKPTRITHMKGQFHFSCLNNTVPKVAFPWCHQVKFWKKKKENLQNYRAHKWQEAKKLTLNNFTEFLPNLSENIWNDISFTKKFEIAYLSYDYKIPNTTKRFFQLITSVIYWQIFASFNACDYICRVNVCIDLITNCRKVKEMLWYMCTLALKNKQ